MKYTELLIKHIKAKLEKATDVDEGGVEFWKDLSIPACDMQDLSNLVNGAEKELKDKKWEDMLGLLKARVAGNDQEVQLYWKYKPSGKLLFQEIEQMYQDFKDWYEK